jgi:hypothetical protein
LDFARDLPRQNPVRSIIRQTKVFPTAFTAEFEPDRDRRLMGIDT